METTFELTGTEKQIKYAMDLLTPIVEKIEKLESKGKVEGQNYKNKKAFISAIPEGASAGNIITIINNFGHCQYAVENTSRTWEVLIEDTNA